MSEADRRKWDARYAGGSYEERKHPSVLLAEWLPDLPRGRALDLACGAGRNALHLARAGYEVDAVDISAVALERAAADAAAAGLDINFLALDLEREALFERDYDLIVMLRYVNLPLLRTLGDRLRDGGYLLTEQHLTTPREVVGPCNPAFRVAPNVLLRAAAPLRVLWYREGLSTDPDGRRAALAQLVACRGSARFDRNG